METEPRLAGYGKRSVLILGGKKDDYSHKSSAALEKAARGEKKLVVYDMAEHGADILQAVRGADSLVVDWLHGYR